MAPREQRPFSSHMQPAPMSPASARGLLEETQRREAKGRRVAKEKKERIRRTAAASRKPLVFDDIWQAYPKDPIRHLDPATHLEIFDNHCAINVSESLVRRGIELRPFRGTKCHACPNKRSVHAIRAQELADWLKTRPFPECPAPTSHSGSSFKKDLKGKRGIVFFKDYWQRDPEKGTEERTGDHIDLWDDGTLAGSGMIGSFIRITLGFNFGDLSDHTLSKEVLFWELK